jgi:mercuric ion transport protein
LVLGFAWYQKLKPKKQIDCNCETEEKPKFIQSKMFLGIVTAFAIVMLAFPYYAHIFYPKTEKQIIVVDKSNVQTVEFTISGMTCASCEEHVNHEVNKLSGIIKSTASYENGNAIVEFDNSKTNISEIEKAINGTGYSVTDKKENKMEIKLQSTITCPNCGHKKKKQCRQTLANIFTNVKNANKF